MAKKGSRYDNSMGIQKTEKKEWFNRKNKEN